MSQGEERVRLGGFFQANSVSELSDVCRDLDRYGLSAIGAPQNLLEMSSDTIVAFSERARTLDITIGEAGFWVNLLTQDEALRKARIKQLRQMLLKAELMDCKCVVILVGTVDPSDHPLAPHPYLYTDDCKAEFREIILHILDGLELTKSKLAVEPWHNTFFYQPEEIAAFFAEVNHPSLGLHLDQMNMINQNSFFNTTELIKQTFSLLSKEIVSVHLKDLRCDFNHMFLKWDEVLIGDGVMDYITYLKCLAKLPVDMTCFCEHFTEKSDYITSFRRLHRLAEKAGVKFLSRSVQ